MKQHPQIIDLYQIYNQESQPFRKVHRMIDLFESIIKTHTVVILGEYFKQNKYSNAAKGLLASGLRTPSLGTWQLFSRVLYKELAAENHVFFQVDFALSLLENLKTMNIKKQTLQHSFAKRIYCYSGLSNSVFKEHNITSKFIREHIILGWSSLKYASLSSVGTDLPDIPITEFNNVFLSKT
jgi:hypothetical protein